MKVLQIANYDSGLAGGGIAMQRLHLRLREAGIESKILCRSKKLDSRQSVAIPHGKLLSKLEYGIRGVTSRLGLNDIHCLSTFGITRLRDYIDADLLNFHCIHGGFFNYLALPSITATKPAVLTLHDMWAFTGHCSYSYDCDRWKIGCGRCPYPDIQPAVQRDNTRLEWKLKDWVYSRSNLVVVAPSIWMTELAKQSMLARFQIHHIPNGVDIDTYKPLDREQCRAMLGIPKNKKVLTFVAMRLEGSNQYGFRKGGDLLLRALNELPPSIKAQCTLLLLGDGGEALAEAVGVPTLNLGYVRSDRLKAIAYSASDLFVFPTRADNMPLVLLESMACGTPMVSIKVGGVPDVVRPGITGYLAEPDNPTDLRRGIVELLDDQGVRDAMRAKCREIAVKEYSLALHVERYMDLYFQLAPKGGAASGVTESTSN